MKTKIITVGPTETSFLGDTGEWSPDSVADAIDEITFRALKLQFPDAVVRMGDRTHVDVGLPIECVRDARNEVYLGFCEGDWEMDGDESADEIALRLYWDRS
jgi:hypothetical protein